MNESRKKNLAKKIASSMIHQEKRGWPPGCIALSYQPTRPVSKSSPSDVPRPLSWKSRIV